MKIIFTSMLLMIMAVAHAMPVPTDTLENSKTTKSNNSQPAVSLSIQNLQEENSRLKAKLAEMETRAEEEKSLLQYNYTMLRMVTNLEGNNQLDKMEDLMSQLSYNKLMGETLLNVNSITAK